jgi:hypothetical protein
VTRPLKKRFERIYVEETAKRLGRPWIIGPDREHPDFAITEGTQQFGLEVCEIFSGPQSSSGSAMKATESHVQKAVDAIRREYEAVEDIPLIVKFVGDMSADDMAMVAPALAAMGLSSKPVGHHDVIDGQRGLRVHVTRAFRPDWYSVNNRVGWVDRNPIQRIAEAVEKKARELPRYKAALGSDDVRLLLVANRIHNSGKMILENPTSLSTHGFSVVYFFPFPEEITVFETV